MSQLWVRTVQLLLECITVVVMDNMASVGMVECPWSTWGRKKKKHEKLGKKRREIRRKRK